MIKLNQEKVLKCCICEGAIDKHYTPEGVMYWDKGHNPYPVKDGPDDRCCDRCNATVVIPVRLGVPQLDGFWAQYDDESERLDAHHDEDDPFKFDIGGEG